MAISAICRFGHAEILRGAGDARKSCEVRDTRTGYHQLPSSESSLPSPLEIIRQLTVYYFRTNPPCRTPPLASIQPLQSIFSENPAPTAYPTIFISTALLSN
jgi:hypothetical protein